MHASTTALPERENAGIFRHGLCDAMAIRLHETTGLPLGLWRGYREDDQGEPGDEAYEDCHAVAVISFDPPRWIDVDGVHDGVPNLQFGEPVDRVALVPASETEVREAFSAYDDGVEEGLALASAFIETDALLHEAIAQWTKEPETLPTGP